jgi:hypothetical protein
MSKAKLLELAKDAQLPALMLGGAEFELSAGSLLCRFYYPDLDTLIKMDKLGWNREKVAGRPSLTPVVKFSKMLY